MAWSIYYGFWVRGKSGYPHDRPKLIPVLLAVLPDLLSQASVDQQSCQLIGAYVNELLKCVDFLSSQTFLPNAQIPILGGLSPSCRIYHCRISQTRPNSRASFVHGRQRSSKPSYNVRELLKTTAQVVSCSIAAKSCHAKSLAHTLQLYNTVIVM